MAERLSLPVHFRIIDARFAKIEDEALQALFQLTRQYSLEIANAIASTDLDAPAFVSMLIARIDSMGAEFEPQYREILTELGVDMARLGGEAIADNEGVIEDQSFFAGLIAGAGLLAIGIVATLGSIAKEQVRLRLGQGINTSQTLTRIRQGFARHLVSVRRMVRTETTRIFNAGHLLAGRGAAAITGKRMVKQWVTIGDDRVRPTHNRAEDQPPIPLHKLFKVGNSRMRYPGDPKGEYKEIVNCRCRLRITNETARQ